MCTKCGRFTGHHSGDSVCELTDRDKYILEKLEFLERHIAHVPSWQTCCISIKFIHHHIYICVDFCRNAVF